MALVDFSKPLDSIPPSPVEARWDRLHLFLTPAPLLFSPCQTIPLVEARDTRTARKEVKQLAQRLDYAGEQIQELDLATGEATNNAVKYGGGGIAKLFCTSSGLIVEVKNRNLLHLSRKRIIPKRPACTVETIGAWQSHSGYMVMLGLLSVTTRVHSPLFGRVTVRLSLGEPAR